MIRAKNDETVSKFVKVMPSGIFFSGDGVHLICCINRL